MKRISPLLAILFFATFALFGQCYETKYDVLHEKICLKGSSFNFSMFTPLNEKYEASGSYKRKGDTLVFNPGIEQNKVRILECPVKKVDRDKNWILLKNEAGEPLRHVFFRMDEKIYETDDDGYVSTEQAFSQNMSFHIQRIDWNLWPNPYQQFWVDTQVDFPDSKGNFLTIVIDTSLPFKIPFAYETKLLWERDTLWHLKNNKEYLGLFWKEVQ